MPASGEPLAPAHPGDVIPGLQELRGLFTPERPGAEPALALEVAGLQLVLEGAPAASLGPMPTYRPFLCGAPGGEAFRLRVVPAGRDSYLMLRPAERSRVHIEARGDELLACSYDWAGWLDLGRSRGGLALAAPALADGVRLERALQNFLRITCSYLLAGRRGFLLHACGLERDGRAWIFFGPSGAGKTTVARLSPGTRVLSDDMVLIRQDRQTGGFLAVPAPFAGDVPATVSTNPLPVGGFFRLRQAQVNEVAPLRGARATGELLACVPFVMQCPKTAERTMDTVAAAVASVPISTLRFRREASFWDVVDAPQGAGVGVFVDDFSAVGGIRS